jgi:signal transduction histidine kinase
VLALGIMVAGVLLHVSTRAGARHRGGAAIDAVAALKVKSLQAWREGALNDVRAASAYQEMVEAAERAANLGDIFRFEAGRVMGDLARTRGFVRVAIVSQSGEVLVNVSGVGKPGPAPDLALVRRALEDGPASSLVASFAEKRTRLELAAPIPADGPVRCVLYAQTDGNVPIAAAIRGWPVPSETGDTLVVTRDGDDAIFLTEPRFTPNAAFTVRVPVSDAKRGLVQAILSEGIHEAVDHRGTPIVVASRWVPGSQLVVISRMDVAELEQPLVGPLNQLTVLVLVLLAAGALGLFWVQREERRHERVLGMARRELETSEQRLKLALEGTHWVWDWDLEAGALTADPEWARSVGLPYHALLGDVESILSRLVHPDDRPLTAERIQSFVRGKGPSLELEFRTRLPVGERWIRLRASISEQGPDGRARRLIGVLSDVTHQRSLQAQLERSERMASLGTLAAGVAHEINNPLTYVVSNLETLERSAGADRPELLEPVRQAREGIERVREVVRGLRSFSRGGTARGPVDVGEELAAALRIARNELQHRATLELQIRPMPAVDAKGRELGQVFLNLLLNAGQAIPEGADVPGRVQVNAGTDPQGRARIEIVDDGVGIPPEVLPRIFEPFFTTKPLGIGTGLGLAIAHNVVTAAGGTIEVESQLGVGSTFRVLLPPARITAPAVAAGPSLTPSPSLSPSLPPPPPPSLPPPPSPSPSLSPSPPRSRPPARAPSGPPVLVVDDEPLVARSIARALQADHPVEVAASAQEARVRIEGGARFGAVVCDLMMPVMTGMDLHEWVAARDPALADRFVFVTGGAFTQRSRDFLDRAQVSWVEKPFEPERLREAVRAAIAVPAR